MNEQEEKQECMQMPNERIKQLLEKTRLTKEEKFEIAAACGAEGIEIRKTTCTNCYFDALVELYNKRIKSGSNGKLLHICKDGYRVSEKYGQGFSINGRRMNFANFDTKYILSMKCDFLLTKCEQENED